MPHQYTACGKPLVIQILHGRPLECRKTEGHTDECSAMVTGSYDMALCGALNPTPGRAQACWLEPEHPGRHTWDRCGDTGEGSGVLCERERGHDGLRRMEW